MRTYSLEICIWSFANPKILVTRLTNFLIIYEILSESQCWQHFQNGVGEKQIQLSRSICVNQVSEDGKYTLASWKVAETFTKNFDFLKLTYTKHMQKKLVRRIISSPN